MSTDFLTAWKPAIAEMHRAAAEVEITDQSRKMIRAAQIVAAGNVAVAKAEYIAEASEEYINVCRLLADARRRLAEARAATDYLEKSFAEWQSRGAMRRAQMQARDV